MVIDEEGLKHCVQELKLIVDGLGRHQQGIESQQGDLASQCDRLLGEAIVSITAGIQDVQHLFERIELEQQRWIEHD